jgi:hypothetical protein
MPDDDLTPVQRSVLLVLMAEAHTVANAYLTNDRKLKLERERRDDLEKRGLIKVTRKGQLVFMELTERGWRWCGDQDGAEVPDRAGHGAAAAYAILAGLRRNLPRLKLSLNELFARYDAAEQATGHTVTGGAVGPTDVEAQIRKAYQRLAAGPGHWVKLADLRDVLGALDRSEVDRMLVGMNRTPAVSIVPESNQKILTDRDRAAAIQIGNQDKHLIAIGSS